MICLLWLGGAEVNYFVIIALCFLWIRLIENLLFSVN